MIPVKRRPTERINQCFSPLALGAIVLSALMAPLVVASSGHALSHKSGRSATECTPATNLPSVTALDQTTAAALTEVSNTLIATYGQNTKEDPTQRLSRGIVGQFSQDNSVVVVVDPSLVDVTGLQQTLTSTLRSDNYETNVTVQPSCLSAFQLVKSFNYLTTGDWPGREKATFGIEINPRVPVWEVYISADESYLFEAVQAQLGPTISLVVGPASRSGRYTDEAPHKGGSGITGSYSNSYDCSSGFTVMVEGGSTNRGTVTAGHCWNNGNTIFSKIYYEGTTARESSYPVFDMILVTDDITSYAAKIWRDPDTTRDVVGARDASQNESVCLSGAKTGWDCGITVESPDGGSICDPVGVCTYGLGVGRKTDICAGIGGCGGDSGAPIFATLAGDDVGIRGMMIGQLSTNKIVWEVYSGIRTHLNVHIATVN